MVDFNHDSGAERPEDHHSRGTPDYTTGRLPVAHTLNPLQLLLLRAFKPPGSSDVIKTVESLVVTLAGPSASDFYSLPEGGTFKAQFDFYGGSHCVVAEKFNLGDVNICASSGTLVMDGQVTLREIDQFLTVIQDELVSSALTRTATVINRNLQPALASGDSQEILAKHGVDLEALRLIMNKTDCIEPEDARAQSRALVKVLASDELVGHLIAGLGGTRSIITAVEDECKMPHLLRSISDAFLVAQHGIVDNPHVPLHALLQDKTTLALVGEKIAKVCRTDFFSPWIAVLPQN